MNAKIVLASLVALATISPFAHATTGACADQTTLERGACADAGGFSQGSCASGRGYATDAADVWVDGPGSQRGASLSWSCAAWADPGSNNTTAYSYASRSIVLSSWSSHDGQWHYAEAMWYAYDASDGSGGCATVVSNGPYDLAEGCPAGAPPAPPVALP